MRYLHAVFSLNHAFLVDTPNLVENKEKKSTFYSSFFFAFDLLWKGNFTLKFHVVCLALFL